MFRLSVTPVVFARVTFVDEGRAPAIPQRSVPPLMVVFAVYVFAAPRESVLATLEAMMRLVPVPEIARFKLIIPVPPKVIVLVEKLPRSTVLLKPSAAVDKAGGVAEPKEKSPFTKIPPGNLVLVKLKLAVPAMVPPLICK